MFNTFLAIFILCMGIQSVLCDWNAKLAFTNAKFTNKMPRIAANQTECTRNPVECLMFCQISSSCLTIAFNAKEQTCYLYERDPMEFLSASHWKTYFVQNDCTMYSSQCQHHPGYVFRLYSCLCIKLYKHRQVTYKKARSLCRADGGELVKIDRPLVQMDIENLLEKCCGKQIPVIIQGRRSNETGDYVFEDGSHMSFSNWADGEPSPNINGNFVILGASYRWYKIGLHKQGRFLCQVAFTNSHF